jgi:hypothetical protein
MDELWWMPIVMWTARFGMVLSFVPPILLTVTGKPLLPPSTRRRWLGRIRDALWNGRFAERLIARLTPPNRALPSGDFRPTELALEIALGDLYWSLPEEYRANLPALPETAQRLTSHGAELRAAIDRADAEVGDAGPLRGELARVVTALERLRLGLLRLHGGMTDLAPLSTTLDAAQLLADHSHRLADAQREVTGGAPIALERAVPTPV